MLRGMERRLTIENVPDDLKFKFKLWCLSHKSTMRAELIRLMQWTVEKDRKGKIE